MMQNSSRVFTYFLPFVVFCLFIGLQVNVALPLGTTYVRLYLSDLILPVTFFAVVTCHVSQRGWVLPRLDPKLVLICILICAWFTYSLYVGFQKIGYLQNWAFYNKYLGLFVLLGYLLTCFMVADLLNSEKLQMVIFCSAVFSCLTIIYSTIQFLSVFVNGESYGRFIGFAGNPNIYGFILCVMLLLCAITLKGSVPNRRSVSVIIFCLAFGIIMTASKSAWLAVVVTLLFVHLLKPKVLFSFLKPLVFGIAFSIAFLYVWGFFETSPYIANIELSQLDLTGSTKNSASHRGQMYLDAYTLWLTQPIQGTGLGSFLFTEQLNDKHYVIHSTPLWLLTETGIVGLLLFCCFAILLSVSFWKELKTNQNMSWSLLGLSVIIFFVVFSIPTEVLYQRIMWCVVGVSLGGMLKIQ